MSDTPPQYFEPLLYISEFTDMLNDDETIEQITRSFSDNPTVTILSRPPSIEQESHVDDEAPSSYHTADNSRSPVLIHPTVRRPYTPHPLMGILRRTQSAPITDYCTICARTGHSLVNCILRGPIVCSYCREVGHTRGVCNRLRMDIVSYHPRLQYCDIHL